MSDYNSNLFGGGSSGKIQRVIPVTTDTVTVAQTTDVLIVNPIGTIAVLTINLPSSPINGQELTIASSQIVVALTVGNGTLIGTLTSLAVAGFAKFKYVAADSSWYRIG